MTSTIDTVESVLKRAEYNEKCSMIVSAAMLTRYAALLEAVNRPVSKEEIYQANFRYRESTYTVRGIDGVLIPAPNDIGLQSALEHHMAALR